MLKVFFFVCLFFLKLCAGKLSCGSPRAHLNGLIAEDDVGLLAAALRIQVCSAQL